MVHRDISQGNILLSEEDPNEALLIDFGLSQWLPDDTSMPAGQAGESYHHHVTVSHKLPPRRPDVH